MFGPPIIHRESLSCPPPSSDLVVYITPESQHTFFYAFSHPPHAFHRTGPVLCPKLNQRWPNIESEMPPTRTAPPQPVCSDFPCFPKTKKQNETKAANNSSKGKIHVHGWCQNSPTFDSHRWFNQKASKQIRLQKCRIQAQLGKFEYAFFGRLGADPVAR